MPIRINTIGEGLNITIQKKVLMKIIKVEISTILFFDIFMIDRVINEHTATRIPAKAICTYGFALNISSTEARMLMIT